MAAKQAQSASIWTQMSYVPPRGPCSQKMSIVSTCSCYRFMIHPLKAATSFECDGCGHHASFHKMDNQMDEETVLRWKAYDNDRDQHHARQTHLMDTYVEAFGKGAAKRRKIEDVPNEEDTSAEEVVELPRREVARVKRRVNGK